MIPPLLRPTAEDAQAALRLDMQDFAARGELFRWHQLVNMARALQWFESSLCRPVYAEILAADALIRFFSSRCAP